MPGDGSILANMLEDQIKLINRNRQLSMDNANLAISHTDMTQALAAISNRCESFIVEGFVDYKFIELLKYIKQIAEKALNE